MVRRHKGAFVAAAVRVAAVVGLLSWSTSADAQSITEYPIPTAGSGPNGIAAGPDGALWFTEFNANKIGRITTAGTVTEFSIPTPSSFPIYITAGPDGALWFSENSGNKIGRITTAGTVTEYTVPTAGSLPAGIAAGPDGALWFTENVGNKIGRITTAGAITEFAIPTSGSSPVGITAGPDGALWFAEYGVPGCLGTVIPCSISLKRPGKIGRITTAGVVTAEYPLPVLSGPVAAPIGIAAGPDGALWFGSDSVTNLISSVNRITTSGMGTAYALGGGFVAVDIAAGSDGALWFASGFVGRITTSGTITKYSAGVAAVVGIAAGPDGALWFTDSGSNKIGRITTPASTSPLVAAILPSSRSVQVGNTATAFATIINAGSAGASGCAIVPVTPVPASFVYQTTNPATNALTGSPNTPVSIPAGGSQSFVIAFTANAPSAPTTVALGFDCSGLDAAASNAGLNTLLLSASATPVPDVVALAATAQNDGILHIAGTMGSSAFAVATVNVGASGSITATANTGAVTLPLAVSLCQTNPSTGQCVSSIGPSVTFTINANATPTVAIFASASGQIPFVPQTNRIFVQFDDAAGIVRGSTSVAVETQ